jgi:hypothetical protein
MINKVEQLENEIIKKLYNWNDNGLKKNQDEEFIVLISEVTGGGGVVD